MKKIVFLFVVLIPFLFTQASIAQNASDNSRSTGAQAAPVPMAITPGMATATGVNYFGADLGVTYNWYSGNSNFFFPYFGTGETDGHSVFTYDAFDGLGSGLGFLLGIKGGLALSNSFDLEAKLRFLTNHTSAQENHTVPINLSGIPNGPTTQEPITNSYHVTLDNLDFDVLGHFKIAETWYLAGGISVSDLLSNNLYLNQIKNGGATWTYNDQTTGGLSNDTSTTFSGSQSNFFSSVRAGVLVGAGTVFPLGSGSSMLDAELLLSIPLTNWLQSSAENTITTDATSLGLPAVNFPKLWYASLTIGIRFPFGGNSNEPGAMESSSSSEPTQQAPSTVELKGRVTDDKTGNPVPSNLTVVDLTNNQVVANDHTDDDGRYSVRVKAPGKYSVTADADGYLFGTAYFEVDDQGRILSRHPDIKLSSTSGGHVRLLVFFDFNSANLKQESYPELNRAVRLMKAVPSMKVEIAGYTDNIGSDDVNQKLSQQRANAVRTYLIQNGIDGSRVTAKGYGKASPIADNSTDDGRAENRRVEFVVLSR